MKSCFKKNIYLFTVCIFCSSLIIISCTSSNPNKFHNEIQSMSDTDLLNYYHGINDRIKDIDSEIKREESPTQTEQEHLISNMPFLIGGEGYRLIQKREMILKELNIRKLSP